MFDFLGSIWRKAKNKMGFFSKNRNLLRISPDDTVDDFICNKLEAGENVSLSLENGPNGQTLVISANSVVKNSLFLNQDGLLDKTNHLVVVDASKNHVIVTLPNASEYSCEPLYFVCADATHGIEVVSQGNDVIFDSSNIKFNAQGDALTFICGFLPKSVDAIANGDSMASGASSVAALSEPIANTWFVVSRTVSQWYA